MQSGNAVILCVMALAGCMPVKQSHMTGGQKHDSFLYIENERYALLQIGPSTVPKTFKIVDAESSAVAPDGTRYGISTKPHDYDLRPDKDAGVPYVRGRVYLVDASAARMTRSWQDGSWQFHFVRDGARGREVRDFTLDLSTFNYNPILHGAPN